MGRKPHNKKPGTKDWHVRIIGVDMSTIALIECVARAHSTPEYKMPIGKLLHKWILQGLDREAKKLRLTWRQSESN